MATYRALLSLKSSLDDPDSRLSALRLLNLSNNVFNRTFPPELSNLTNLRVLDLYNNNHLTGVLQVRFSPGKVTPAQATCATSAEPTTWRTPGGCQDGCAPDLRPEEAWCTRCRGRARQGAAGSGVITNIALE
ncbi:hypothetical protein ACLB2K_028799 [Fragaria x ananassa]